MDVAILPSAGIGKGFRVGGKVQLLAESGQMSTLPSCSLMHKQAILRAAMGILFCSAGHSVNCYYDLQKR